MTKNSGGARPVGLGSGGTRYNANDLMARDQEIAGHWNTPTAGPTLPTGKPIPTGPDVHPGPDMNPGSGDGLDGPGIPLLHPTDPLVPTPAHRYLLDDDGYSRGPMRQRNSITAPVTPPPTTLDWGVNPNASTQDQVNDIYSAPTIVNPPPAPAATAAPGLAGIQRRSAMGGKAMQLNAGMR